LVSKFEALREALRGFVNQNKNVNHKASASEANVTSQDFDLSLAALERLHGWWRGQGENPQSIFDSSAAALALSSTNLSKTIDPGPQAMWSDDRGFGRDNGRQPPTTSPRPWARG